MRKKSILNDLLFLALSKMSIKCSCGHWSKRALIMDGKEFCFLGKLFGKERPLYCPKCITNLPFMTCLQCQKKIRAGERFLKVTDENGKDSFLGGCCIEDGVDFMVSTIYDPLDLKQKTRGGKNVR